MLLEASWALDVTAAAPENYYRPEHPLTQAPIIGMLTLPVAWKHQLKYGSASFAASYVRWIEAGGARVAPIHYDSSPEELYSLLGSVNGVVWTGGLVDFNPTADDPEGSKYLATTQAILEYVLARNEGGTYYPFWATCLGFERLTQLLARDVNSTIIDKVDAENLDINLNLTPSGWLSRMFGGMSYELFKEVASPWGHLAFNNHGLGITPEKFKASAAYDYLSILSIDPDRNGKEFVSTVEGRSMPIYGSQWHPEKAAWEWDTRLRLSHVEHAVEFSSYLGSYFVNECKYNNHTFASPEAEARALIYNWVPVPTGPITGIKSAYTNIYFFPKDHSSWWAKHAKKDATLQHRAFKPEQTLDSASG